MHKMLNTHRFQVYYPVNKYSSNHTQFANIQLMSADMFCEYNTIG